VASYQNTIDTAKQRTQEGVALYPP